MTKTHRNAFQRRLFSEVLETRTLMASDFHNFLEPHDVNDDRRVSPLDALVVINKLNRAEDSPGHHAFEDVNDDSKVTPMDALLVVNSINASVGSADNTVKVVSSPTSSARVRVEVETEGAKTEFSIRMESSGANQSFAVSLNDIALGEILTDDRGRGQLKLANGDDNRTRGPIPASLLPLSPTMELVIGDVVRGSLGDVAKIETHNGGGDDSSGGSDDDNSSGGSDDDNSSGGSSNSTSQEVHLTAAFPTVNRATGSAEYESETERGVTKNKFKAEIERGVANTTYSVKVGGVEVGTITTDSRGKGKLSLSSQPRQGRDLPMPANFPAVAVGTSVTVGELSAAFQVSR